MLSGTKLGRYEIGEKIGAGGMGEVYQAKDEQLDRNVALKVLLPEFCCDEERVSRFKHEAKAASALNHPNIITIYEIGEDCEQLFIATELVQGETLREKIESGELTLLEAVRIAEQSAEALAVAHEAHIVHRDIKPENIMIRRDGIVKLLDFGLAKPIFGQKTGAEAETVRLIHTQPGMVMGSVRYMSPEQARGKETDERTDVWSLGVVLYEMLTGKNPFEGETVSDSLAALIHIEPAPVEDIPEELQRILRKALKKKTDERYQSIKDFALDLKDLRLQAEHNSAENNLRRIAQTVAVARHDTSENQTLIHHTTSAENATGKTENEIAKTQILKAPKKSNLWRFLPFGVLTAALILAAAGIFLLPKIFGVAAPKFDSIQISRLTDNGNAHLASISPDGKLVSFVNRQNGRQSLVVRQIATGSTLEIVAPTVLEIGQPVFTPSGDHIYYLTANSGIGTIFQVSPFGGESKKITDDVDSKITFSPDSQQFAFIRHNPNEGGDTIFTVNADGSNLAQFVSTKEIGFDKFTGLAWSADGKRILVGVFKNTSDTIQKVQIATIEIESKQFRKLGERNWIGANSFEFSKDNSEIFFLGRPNLSDTSQIWQMNFPTGEAKQITNDTSDYASLSLSADTNAIITTRVDAISSLWSLEPNTGESKQLSGESRNLVGKMGISHNSEGRILFSKKTGEEINIFSAGEDGSDEKQLTSGAKINFEAKATPDGKYIIFSSNRNGYFNIWRIDADGKNPLQLTDYQGGTDGQIDITPDGKSVIFTRQGSDGGKMSVMRVAVEGGATQTLFPDKQTSNLFPRISPDGKSLLYQTFHYDDKLTQFRSSVNVVNYDGTPKVKPEEYEIELNSQIAWSPDGKSFTYINHLGVDNLWNIARDSRKEKPLTDFKSGYITSFTWSADGRRIFIVKAILNSDLVLIKDNSKI